MAFSLVGLLLLSVAPTLGMLLLAAGADGHRLVGLPSGVVAGGAHGVGRPARPRAVGLSGRRQFRHRRSGRCSRRSSCVPRGQSSIAWCSLRRAARDRRCSSRVGSWSASIAPAGRTGAAPHGRQPRHRACRAGTWCCALRDPRRADLLEVLLSGQPDQLLHVLSDQQVPRLGAERADSPVRVSRRASPPAPSSADRSAIASAAKYVIWGSILGVLPFTLAAALRQPVLDRRPDGGHRPDPRVGVLGDPGLRAGTGAGPRRARSPASSSASRSAWAASAPRRSASSPTARASIPSTACAPTCR